MQDFKVKCVNTTGVCHTIGRIYDVIDGKLQSDFPLTEYPYGGKFSSVESINNYMMGKFELVKSNI